VCLIDEKAGKTDRPNSYIAKNKRKSMPDQGESFNRNSGKTVFRRIQSDSRKYDRVGGRMWML